MSLLQSSESSGDCYLGLARGTRCSPGFHMAGFQPSRQNGRASLSVF